MIVIPCPGSILGDILPCAEEFAALAAFFGSTVALNGDFACR
jgi:hypothetical protein